MLRNAIIVVIHKSYTLSPCARIKCAPCVLIFDRRQLLLYRRQVQRHLSRANEIRRETGRVADYQRKRVIHQILLITEIGDRSWMGSWSSATAKHYL